MVVVRAPAPAAAGTSGAAETSSSRTSATASLWAAETGACMASPLSLCLLSLAYTWARANLPTAEVINDNQARGSSRGLRMSTAFVLIEVEPGCERDVYLSLLDIDSVSETHVAYGEYDLVARIDFDDEREMARTLIGSMRSISGVIKTETLIAVEV
ncbi:MAG: hypothetical protein CXX69_03895 [Candidatus Thalassarchaeum betae]|uniref:Transcription regulator AsnC/Lrp ligand binding domain-containing protein n=2 Tax=Candidatus Thalassarchaeum betae TaxID=2599289 RepID=A0A2V3HR35_9ARCH|nr:MAG: hypothetical protein CXX69_03895 [Candidatus Thalassoarchaea betae]PXF25827.1 MAG: hypothetical protein CXX70_05815 [Euryarchaeota archaeon]HIC50779.1 Lrp/AsnC family transcriptional regulator [Candidatus Poseidoniales archaeon]HIM13903.1 Lrp/AsnC family transcriptional regulator [Candidatus Poseidoniales archaeon]HIM92573.1 Lrp/AsnC family transcriptional regulator [Candidatus Poseidoniales archaeon]